MKLFKFDEFLAESNGDKPYKDYNEDMPLSELEPGDAVTYRGMPCVVDIKNDGAVTLKRLNIKAGENDTVRVNQAMFNQACYVKEKNAKPNLQESLLRSLRDKSPVADAGLKAMGKKLKFPAGSVFGNTYVLWKKNGGHAGDKAVSRVMANAKELGWKSEFKQSTHPAYDIVVNSGVLYDPAGLYKLETRKKYGVTAYENYYELQLTFLKKES